MLRRLRLVLAVLGLLVMLLEVGIRGLYGVRDALPPAGSESLRQEWQWAQEHLLAGKPVLESTLAYDAGLGWRSAPALRLPGLTTNSEGWRSASEFAREKPPGVRRLILLGDSYTFGQGVADHETFCARLQARLGPEWEVLNFGVPGYGTDQQLLCYETVARHYAPDVVVLGFFLRDYSRNLLDFRTYAKPRFVLEGDALRLLGSPVIAPEELFGLYVRGERRVGGPRLRSWLLATVRQAWGRMRTRDIHEDAEGWRLLARMQRRFRDAVLADGAVPLWLQIPTEGLVRGDPGDYARLLELSGSHAASIGLDSVDLAPVFRRHEAGDPAEAHDRPAELGGHLSPTGHALVAEALGGWLDSLALDRN